jgi:AbrB family looped-hinge helix DNA binding protein
MNPGQTLERGEKTMRVTSKGQVTIPQPIRNKLGITPAAELDFVEENGRVYLIVRKADQHPANRFRKLRGVATVRMSTDEIMALTRGAA